MYDIVNKNKEVKKSLKFSVQVVILNEEGELLCVSRKTDHNDFGLPGGKVDPEDASFEAALIREVKEETGLTIYEKDLTQIFSMYKDGYMGYTYLCEYFEGKIETDEPHVVKWGPFQKVIDGSFGTWNKMVSDSLRNMGITFKFR